MTDGLKGFPFGKGVVCLAVLLTLTGCGGDGDKPRIRLLNAAPGTSSLEFKIDDNTVASGVAYSNASDYAAVKSGSRDVDIVVSGTDSNLLAGTVSLNPSTTYTLVAANFASSAEAVLLTDDTTKPDSGKVHLRVLQASPTLGDADVYVVTPGADYNTMSPTNSGLSFTSSTGYMTLDAGNYDIYVTFAGTKLVMIHRSSTSFAAGDIRPWPFLTQRAADTPHRCSQMQIENTW